MSSFDLYFNGDGGTQIYYLNEIGGAFLTQDNSWDVYAVVSNYTNTVTETFETAAQLDTVEETIRLSLTYPQILGVLGPRDPGTIDLYASRPSLGNPAVDEVINLITGNVIYQLGDRVSPIVIP